MIRRMSFITFGGTTPRYFLMSSEESSTNQLQTATAFFFSLVRVVPPRPRRAAWVPGKQKFPFTRRALL